MHNNYLGGGVVIMRNFASRKYSGTSHLQFFSDPGTTSFYLLLFSGYLLIIR